LPFRSSCWDIAGDFSLARSRNRVTESFRRDRFRKPSGVYNTPMEPRGVFVGEKVRLPDWYDPPERMVDEPIVEEISTEHRAFSTHTVAKVSWSVAKLQGEGVIHQSRLFRVEDLRST
jgi:hypothetical protein